MVQSRQLVLSGKSVNGLYKKLLKHYGPQGWWPLRTRRIHSGINVNYTLGFNSGGYHPGLNHRLTDDDSFEIAAGAVLTQNTNWNNAASALDNLIAADFLSAEKIAEADKSLLSDLIRPSGYYNQKALKLKAVASLMLEKKGKIPSRSELLKVWGIGPETADSILLYAYGVPVFVIDLYTRRIFSRITGDSKNETVPYEEMRFALENVFPCDTELRREYHALLVIHAKKFCSKTEKCSGCPASGMCDAVMKSSNCSEKKYFVTETE